MLGSETRFARKQYTNGLGDAIYVSIVLRGEDMSASLHRPERCLLAQGLHRRRYPRPQSPPLPRELTTMRLHNIRPLYSAEGKPLAWRDGKPINEFSLIYY